MATAVAVKSALREELGVKPPAEVIEWIRALIYGEAGAGKTRLAGTAADSKEMSPVLFGDVEGGVTTIRHKNDIDVVSIRSIDTLEKVYSKLVEDKGKTYKTFVLDSVTELQQLDMRTVMQLQFNKRPESTDIDVPSQREWGKNGERMRRIIRSFRDLPINFICTCLMVTEKDSDGKVLGYYPMLPGRQRGEIPGYFDIVGLLTAQEERNGEEIVRRLQTTKTRKVVAKDRFDVLPPVMDYPTMPEIWNLIKEG